MNDTGILHIANTHFEWECSTKTSKKLKDSFLIHPNFVQLQFLPFLYGDSSDYVLLTHEPDPTYWDLLKQFRNNHPKPVYINDTIPKVTRIDSWGPSQLITDWANQHNILYMCPNHSAVCEVSSKEFSFLHSPQLADAMLIKNLADLLQWGSGNNYPKVLKTSFGVAGRGHQIVPCKTALHCEKTRNFCEKEWLAGRPIIGEPWVNRLWDFSTQWMLSKSQIHYLGSTKMTCDHRGTYRSTELSTNEFPEAYFQQKTAYPILKRMLSMGFFGHVGIDGFVYNEGALHPITDINPRKTMGWLAMQLNAPISIVSSAYAKHPLLPFSVVGMKPFKLQLDLSENVRV